MLQKSYKFASKSFVNLAPEFQTEYVETEFDSQDGKPILPSRSLSFSG
jgi:hypothetical protein